MWVVNAEGVYIENRPYHSYLEDDILTAINEKYGTNFSSLTYLREPSIAIGDDCPDWDAYEKIEIQSIYIANIAPGFLGRIIEEKTYIYVNNNNQCFVASSEGVISGTGSNLDEGFKTYIQNVINGKGYNVSEILSSIQSYSVGYEIPKWNEYIIV